MKTLYLLRHAKSSWDDPGLGDFDRPLNSRGRAAAQAMGRQMAALGIRPGLVLCSPARRTRETLDIVRDKMGIGDVRFDDRIYESPRDRLLSILREVDNGPEAVMLIGHNPGIERLASHLAGEGDPVQLDRMGEKFPTCSLAVLSQLDGATDLSPRAFRLDHFLRPADLADHG